MTLIADIRAVVTPFTMPRPGYLTPIIEPGYGTKITRVCADAGMTMPGGVWGVDSRAHYSKDQPWNDDQALLKLEQKDGTPSQFILDANTYRVVMTSEGRTPAERMLRQSHECRWRPGHPTHMISWLKSSQTLVVWDVVTGASVWSVSIPSDCADFGFNGEGVISVDGNRLALGTLWKLPRSSGRSDYFQVVDLVQQRVGPRNAFSMPYPTQDDGNIDWTSISAGGNFVVVKYSDTSTPEYARCFRVNADLSASPQTMSPLGLRMHDTRFDQAGWLACLSHSDLSVVAGREVLVGGVRDQSESNVCGDAQVKSEGRIITVDLATGVHRHISAGSKLLGGTHEASDHHTSARAYRAYGWVWHHYRPGSGQFADEMVAWRTDGSRECKRFGRCHSSESAYRAEAHPCPSPDGTKVLFASDLGGNGISAYVAESA